MKRVFILGVLALTVAIKSMALEVSGYKVFCKLSNESTFNALSKYLDTNADQTAALKHVFAVTDREITAALKTSDMMAADKALWFNLGNAKYILTTEQYKKYLTAINLTVNMHKDELFADNE